MTQATRPTPHRTLATDEDLHALAGLVERARPDWSQPVLPVLLGHRHQVSGLDLAVAALRAAANPDFHTPATIGWRGAHWHGLETQPQGVPTRWCGVCGRREDRCQMARFGDDDHPFEPTRTPPRHR